MPGSSMLTTNERTPEMRAALRRRSQRENLRIARSYPRAQTHSGPRYNFWRRFFAGNWNAPGYRQRK